MLAIVYLNYRGKMKNKTFPTFAIVLLVLAVLWMLSELGVLTISLPWLLIIVVIIALGMVVNHYSRK